MKLASLFEFITAAHQSVEVHSPFEQRGGIMVIAGPESLKTAIVKTALRQMPRALCFSDLTLKQLVVLRDGIGDGKFSTLGFTELEKLYERQASVADNVEGVLKAMTEEGFSHAAFEDKRIWVPNARALVVAAVLRSLYQLRYPRWELNGFCRRFIQFRYILRDKQKIIDAIRHDRLIQFPALFPIMPPSPLPMNVTRGENAIIESLGPQMQTSTPLVITRKVLTVLKWRYNKLRNGRGKIKPLEVLEDLHDGLDIDGGRLEL